MANEEDYDEPADIKDDLDKAEDAIAKEAQQEAEEDEFFDLDDAGFCPVCSQEQGCYVPIPKGDTCECGGYENPSIDHEAQMRASASVGVCYFCWPDGCRLTDGVCSKCGWDSTQLGLLQQCTMCGRRPAKFRFRGEIKADRDHDVCMQCFRSQLQSNLQKQKFATAGGEE
jgi:hypothetical protein